MGVMDISCIPVSGKIDNQFIGLRIENNEIEFHYPESYFLASDEIGLRRDIISILRTIALAKTISSDKSSYNSKRNNEYVFPIKSFLWIINDYLTYGKYVNHEKEYKEGTDGKISWKRTLRSNPAISQGNIVYTKIISEKKSQKDNLLTEIYFFCVQKAIDSIGWLYNLRFDSKGVDYYKLFNQRKYTNAINDEMLHSFDDMKKLRLTNMKNIILGLDDALITSKDIIYGVDSYDFVFEKMIDSMFSRVESKKDFYPNAFWELLYPIVTIPSTNLRPDTVVVKDKKVYILDAKYYRYGTTFLNGDLPDTTSIQKQITYGEYVKKVKEGVYVDVYSAFMMPYSKYENQNKDKLNKDIEFIGIAKAKWIDSKENDRKIAGILIDTKFLVDNWVKNCDQTLNELISLIEKSVGGVKDGH